MPTARSSTEAGLAGWVGAVADLRHLLRFRAATVRRPRAAGVALLVLLGVALVAAVGPLLVDGSGRATFLDDHLGAMLAGFLALAVASSMASGGGRELIPREQAAIHPISIDRIGREAVEQQKVFLDRPYYRWKIQSNWPAAGEIVFGAVGFTQRLRAEPVLSARQHLSRHERRGVL